MFDIGMGEMALLAAIALIAIGPKQLPEVARVVGRFLADIKRMTNEFTRSINDVRDTATRGFTDAAESTNRLLSDMDPHPKRDIVPQPADHLVHAHAPQSPVDQAVDEKDQMSFDLSAPNGAAKTSERKD